jgi:phage terminase large subunit-like protein
MLGDCGQWIPLEVWHEQALQQPPVPPSGEATIGLDLASHVDLAAAVEARRCGDGYWITYHAWASGRAMRESVAARQLQRAHALGMLEASMADAIDFSSIRAWLRLARERGARWLVADPAGAMHLLAEVVADGWPQEQVIEYPQSAAYMDPLIRRVQTLAMEKKLWHQASPLWDLCLGNVRVGQDARGRAYFHKGRSEGPIDLAVALTLAVGWEPPMESAVKPWVEVL